MDILLQYLNIKKRKQEYMKVVDLPCSSVYQALGLEMADRAISFVDYMQQTYRSTYLFVGIIDAEYCNRTTRAVFSYTDFCRLTSGLGETSSID
jgi:hypothetical protein|nr:MAG TPA: hypothetical protein [Microviridae sp.]